MLPIRIAGANLTLKAPPGMNNCTDLHVKREGVIIQSAWEPTPFELEVLNAGGSVVLTIVGERHPPVALAVNLPPKDLGGD